MRERELQQFFRRQLEWLPHLNEDMVRKIGDIIAEEGRAKYMRLLNKMIEISIKDLLLGSKCKYLSRPPLGQRTRDIWRGSLPYGYFRQSLCGRASGKW